MIIYVDIDETICMTPEDLYDNGDRIVYWTARGSGTGIDWREVTEKQFDEWGVKYHELKLFKPIYDLFIDDKNINADRFFKGEPK